ncbi:MAG: hypothetical protein HZC17_00300 [Candidatus Omnitrophica bacterium]|nr:hypothetical protein [Candidatus Omnitrophota bacterium]
MNQIFRNILLLSLITAVVFSGWQGVSATTYREVMKRSHSDEKSAQANHEEESPVLVNYEVGDTSNFYTSRDKTSMPGEESEWEDLDAEAEGSR